MLLFMQRGKAKDALRCMHHRSALRWPSKHAASAIAAHCIRQYTPEHGSTNAFTIFRHTLEKVREADYALFPTTQNREMLRSNSLSFSRY